MGVLGFSYHLMPWRDLVIWAHVTRFAPGPGTFEGCSTNWATASRRTMFIMRGLLKLMFLRTFVQQCQLGTAILFTHCSVCPPWKIDTTIITREFDNRIVIRMATLLFFRQFKFPFHFIFIFTFIFIVGTSLCCQTRWRRIGFRCRCKWAKKSWSVKIWSKNRLIEIDNKLGQKYLC